MAQRNLPFGRGLKIGGNTYSSGQKPQTASNSKGKAAYAGEFMKIISRFQAAPKKQ
jgi:hypothetical protein